MKKLFLILGLVTISFAVWAEGDLPTIIIHKSNGGVQAWFNHYNDVLYTPGDENTPARLDCTGAGNSSCRVPRNNAATLFAVSPASHNGTSLNPNLMPLFADAVNEIIETSERSVAAGNLQGSQSKSIAVRNNSTGLDTYFVKGQWSYGRNGNGTLHIYINQSDLLRRR